MDRSNKRSGPVKVFRARGISASVFENKSKKGDIFHKICLQRTYFDGENYQTSDTFGRDDVPVAVQLLDNAWKFVLETEEAAKKDSSKEENE